jgi:hypothetical protein
MIDGRAGFLLPQQAMIHMRRSQKHLKPTYKDQTFKLASQVEIFLELITGGDGFLTANS